MWKVKNIWTNNGQTLKAAERPVKRGSNKDVRLASRSRFHLHMRAAFWMTLLAHGVLQVALNLGYNSLLSWSVGEIKWKFFANCRSFFCFALKVWWNWPLRAWRSVSFGGRDQNKKEATTHWWCILVWRNAIC